jgi:hypothetical protein
MSWSYKVVLEEQVIVGVKAIFCGGRVCNTDLTYALHSVVICNWKYLSSKT